MQIQSEGEHS